jgi:hypothetical protein
MNRRLVTVAVFDLAPLAHMAKERLIDAGIKAVVADDQMVAMDWLMSNAVGGIKVQVWDEDAERAVRVLEDHLPVPDPDLDPGSATATDATEVGLDDEPPESDFAPDPEPDSTRVEPGGTELSRDDFARRAVFAGLLATLFVVPAWDAIYYQDAWAGCVGVFVVPTAIYAIHLVVNAATGPGELSRRGRKLLWLGALLSATPVMFCLTLLVRPWLG